MIAFELSFQRAIEIGNLMYYADIKYVVRVSLFAIRRFLGSWLTTFMRVSIRNRRNGFPKMDQLLPK
jgi:hypothetical protein